ncbi:hypothetical protein A3A46_03190 [Candidatus Roizmanbacteria bacterium RIFCSPLOWO2_01_FULL_37_13]|uniref:Glycosyltransferase 2-like domain-containing protein n=1 Tax=Candidatus Roizmanbacteria bacterium RIFCSPHIGHO2_02_FULL_38_11 TaxID=1802039 RepID=A0A1F7GX64_9BACT|nr:MAG: hypothetical protein A3C25_02025 [Candidatus Roizmanbacteria bacterium RIFCSPHIGHO2_02_FULL_38_11]OGK43137.1 MAG: hypothetical protein A3A46_03190 [Candidatus Roizmanbacteria bacterium RIFCSPLOWO2_01_FULL_37_13]
MISVIIPTFIKKQLLQNTVRNMKLLKECEVIIVNDNPKKSLINDLKEFKNVTLLENSQNLGFAKSVNKGVKKSTKKYVMLLNDDVLLLGKSYQKALDLFAKDPSLFAISFAQKERTGHVVGKNVLYWKRGLMFHSKSKDMKFGYNAWADGGACLIDKNKFLELGGFDSIYAPFYWEDIDLSYQAWKKGYKILFDPNIVVEHQHESTIGKQFSKKFIETTAFRNQFSFIWKNITDISMLLNHLFFLPFNLFYYFLLKKRINFIRGFFDGIKSLGGTLAVRNLSNRNRKIADKKILALFG